MPNQTANLAQLNEDQFRDLVRELVREYVREAVLYQSVKDVDKPQIILPTGVTIDEAFDEPPGGAPYSS